MTVFDFAFIGKTDYPLKQAVWSKSNPGTASISLLFPSDEFLFFVRNGKWDLFEMGSKWL